jgi:N-carbamoylputrescine amidase
VGLERPLAAGHAGARGREPDAARRREPDRLRAGQRDRAITFYGSSFIADATGDKVAEAGRTEETVITATFDLDANRRMRSAWGSSATAARTCTARSSPWTARRPA